MCRIAGIISATMPQDELLLKTGIMCNVLAHGGPDDLGMYSTPGSGLAFGHRRLAIIDLTDAGHQPMTDTEQKACITFNGEIYNYPELKTELLGLGAVFCSDTDTEVILQSYIHWGTEAFARLRGMFAFALYDIRLGLTYLVRDSGGIKPLYYHINNAGISFASEVRALKKAGLATAPEPDWPVRFLAFGHIPEPYTTLKGVFSLQKGHYLQWDHTNHQHIIVSYFLEFADNELVNETEEAYINIQKSLGKAVKRQLLADAPLGIFLSGGIDSSLLTLLANQHHEQRLQTISIYFDEQEFNERPYQELIIKQTGAVNHSNLVSQQDFEESLPAIIASTDLPTTDGINSWFISKYAHENGLKAVLSGLGADEQFGGYPSFWRIGYLKYLKIIPNFILKLIAQLSIGKLKRLSLLTYDHPMADYLFLRGLFVPSEIAKLLNLDEEQVLKTLLTDVPELEHLTDVQQAAWLETNLYMQNQLLRDTDVMSMAHGLEVRVPFLDEDFVHAIDEINPAIRFTKDQPKKLLINSFSNLLPKEIWSRPKMGFSFPLQEWMRAHPQIGNVNFYREKQARKIINRFNRDGVHWSKAFALYQLQIHREVIKPLPRQKILLLTLETFRSTGGIQKMSRILAQSLQQLSAEHGWQFGLWSGYDRQHDVNDKYVHQENFKGFNKNRVRFAFSAILKSLKSNILVISHINLAPISFFTRLFRPDCRIWLIAHGIEVWRPLGWFKKYLLKHCDRIVCVSNFTMQKLIDLHGVDPARCVVLNNALDPFINLPVSFDRPDYLVKRYGLSAEHKVIFTLTRLESTEQYKGYEHVLKAVSELKDSYKGIRYILSGQYDQTEYDRIKQLITLFDIEEQVILTGFIAKEELEDHFLLADLFVLPSKKEGFGIVFIEALACGLPVICGDGDGSLDAIRNGELGKAINPDKPEELLQAMEVYLEKPLTSEHRHWLQSKCIEYFNAGDYKKTLEDLLSI